MVSAHTKVPMEDAPSLLKIPKSECPDIWTRLPKHKWPKSWSSMEDPVVHLERNLYGHPLARLIRERQLEKVLLKHGREKVPNWECLFVNQEKGLFLPVYVDEKNGCEETKHWPNVESTYERSRSGRTNIIPWPCLSSWVVLNENAKQAKILWKITETCLNPRSLQELKKGYLIRRNLTQTFFHGLVFWKVMRRNAWQDIANLRISRLSSCVKS